MEKIQIENIILEIIKAENGRPIPPGILVEKIKTRTNINDKKMLYQSIESLVERKTLKTTSFGSIIEGYINGQLLDMKIKGRIFINSSLDGYVRVVDEDTTKDKKEYYVNASNLNSSLSGDLVEIQLMDKFNKRNVQHAIVTSIIENNTNFLVGMFQLTGESYNVLLDDKKNYLKVELQDTSKLVNGHKILIEIGKIENGIIYGAVSRILGHIDDVGIEIVSIIAAHGIEPEFSPEAEKQANACVVNVNDNKNVRRDITDRLIITIDPPTSKDLDDAVYVKKLDNGNYFLSVSIADVSHYVTDGELYDETINRATSIYLVDRVIPMLPHYLSNNICSLNPNEPKLCVTCDLEIDQDGKYHNIDVYPSVIKSKHRFSYGEVNDYFNGIPNNLSKEINEMLDISKDLHMLIRKHKYQNGYIDFDIKEPLIVVDEKCWPIDIKIRERGTAQRMIEDFMIAANEAVTIQANKLKMPFIYRVHDVPQAERLKTFLLESKKLGSIFNAKDIENITSQTLTKWIEQSKDNPNHHLISKLLLRCMAKAIYTTDNIGHFGLGSKWYTHFTSPIRRLADLIVHKLYWTHQFDPGSYTDAQRTEFVNQLVQLCDKCTTAEINAVECERDVNQLKFCQYLSDHVNKTFKGIISTIKAFGMFIEIEENTIEGMVKISNIGKDFWIYDVPTQTIVGQKTNYKFTYGQAVDIRVTSVDIPNRLINFEIVGFEQNINKDDYRRNNNRKVDYKKY